MLKFNSKKRFSIEGYTVNQSQGNCVGQSAEAAIQMIISKSSNIFIKRLTQQQNSSSRSELSHSTQVGIRVYRVRKEWVT